MNKFKFYKQLNLMDCGPTCLRMISKFYGKHHNADTLRQLTGFGKTGVSLLAISDAAEKIGFRTRAVKISPDQLALAKHPCILSWNQNHFVVLVKLTSKKIIIADPSRGLLTLSKTAFLKYWLTKDKQQSVGSGIALLLEPGPEFYKLDGEKKHTLSWWLISKYLQSSGWQICQVFIALIITSLLQLIFPFLTQSVVDTKGYTSVTITLESIVFFVVKI